MGPGAWGRDSPQLGGQVGVALLKSVCLSPQGDPAPAQGRAPAGAGEPAAKAAEGGAAGTPL